MHEDCVYLEDKLCSIAMLTNLNISKLQLEVAHFLKIKLRKFYRVHSQTEHPEFYTPKFF